MAISEACQFEIRDEVNGMIDRGDVETKSDAFKKMVEFYRAIGLDIKEATVERKYFRAQKLTNVSNTPTPQNHTETPENQTIPEKSNVTPSHPAKDGTNRGGKREGAGRPVKHQPTKEQKEEIFTPSFKTAYDALYDEVMMAKSAKWQHTTKEAAAKYVKALFDFINL